jgi:PAS domain S-box-containing protein
MLLLAILLVTSAAMLRVLVVFAPVLIVVIPELFGVVFLSVLCMALMWYAGSRLVSHSKLSERPLGEQIIEQVLEGILTIDQRGRVISLNPAAERLFGYRPAEILNEPITTLLTEPPNDSQGVFRDTMPVGTILGLAAGAREMIGRRKNGESFPIELVLSGMTLGDEQVTVAFARDVSKRKQAQRYLTTHYAATCILAETNSLEEALPKILQTLSEALQWEACAYWSFDPVSQELQCVEFHQAPFAKRSQVLDISSVTCQLDQGLPGKACSTGQPIWIEDLCRTQDFPCLALATPLELHAAFAFPVMMGEQVCGVVEVFSARCLKRDPWLLDIMGEFGKQMGHFIARKRDEEMLQRSEERFRQLAENIHEVFWMVDTQEDRVIYISPSCEKVWGRSSMHFNTEHRGLVEFVHPDDQARVLTAYENQKRGAATSEEYRIVRPDQSIRWVWNRAFPITNGAGQVYRVAGVMADITERRHAEEEHGRLLATVEQQRTDLQMILDSVPALIFYKDRQQRLVRVNAAHAQCFGLPKEQIEGKTDAELGSPYASQYMQDDLNVMTTGESLCGLIEKFHTPTGERWLQTDKVPHRDVDGNIIGLVGFAVDITEQKRLEEQLRQAQKMEAVGQLAGGVAHDFNNLLTVIIGYNEILLEQSIPGDPNHELLEQIHNASERAASLTHQLLAFGRKQVLQTKVLDINTVVQDMGKMLRRVIGEDIEMVIEQDPNLGRVNADRTQIEQILMNLASNARDAMPNGGTLTISTANVDQDESQSCLDSEIPPSPYVMLEVTDMGNGMDDATKTHAFEPFFTTKELGKGTGLGLATVYGIVKQSGGYIGLDSALGHGTTFRIYLPRLEEVNASVCDPKSPTGVHRGKETVLLVEDEDCVRNLVSRILQLNGYTVLLASSGAEALELFKGYDGRIDLLLTDVIMPHMNGVQLVEQATSIRENLRVLYLSGYANSFLDAPQGTSASAAAFLSKPVTPQVLAKKVREVLDAPPRLCAG